MIVRIDCRTPSRQVWENQDPSALQPELPRLSVMAGCSKRRVPHEIHVILTGGEIVVPPGLRDSLFVVHVLHSEPECRSSPLILVSGPTNQWRALPSIKSRHDRARSVPPGDRRSA